VKKISCWCDGLKKLYSATPCQRCTVDWRVTAGTAVCACGVLAGGAVAVGSGVSVGAGVAVFVGVAVAVGVEVTVGTACPEPTEGAVAEAVGAAVGETGVAVGVGGNGRSAAQPSSNNKISSPHRFIMATF